MITKASPAKVNLYLRVLRRREDGYHDILSLIQQISLCDEMTFAPRAGGIVIRCPDSLLPEDEGNIVYRAAASFFSRIPAPPGIEITIRKKIPIAAGLGGGSSNAATTLMALNEISGSPLTRDEMLEMGAKLGADVPFFIFGNRAWASGIGDRFTEAAPLPPLWFVLINPGFAVSTKQVYQKLNLELTNGRIKYSIPRFCTVDHLNRGLTNDLEKVTMRLHPVLERIKALLIGSGAGGALMSGSGPTVFGVFGDEESALRAENDLRQESRENRWAIFRAHSL
ncbi:MAG TPA: 4-(cytidine 5'-diphospho)-2-C-methyl-D-erythritol kinase [Syntrophus sp. (in: bacteria)]|nr:4-(cytidine 5'-diphospho)-2-C-methyl-D-erythritol kinase [Syntrophus sp. (in: bacteria)]